jgi:hypothetical protein
MQDGNGGSPLAFYACHLFAFSRNNLEIFLRGRFCSSIGTRNTFGRKLSIMKLFLGLVTVLVTAISGRRQQPIAPNGDGRANIVVILTDDQDLHMDSVDYMPLLKKHVINHGTFYKYHYCSTAICCPSRVTLWTGRNAHNTNVTDVFPPYGECP